jgi:arylsulfatase A-like enzyme
MKRKMTRSTFLLGVGGMTAFASFGVSASAQTTRRNVLWIIDDDHSPYMMDPLPVTRRNIRDAGLKFASGSADVPLCGHARVEILTGLYVQSHQCDTNGTWPKFESSPRKLGERTVARHMKDAGYATGHFGKYINGHLHGEHRLRHKGQPYWESSEVPFFVKRPGVKRGARTALVNHADLMPTACAIAGILFTSLDVDGRSMLANLGRDVFLGWRKQMLITGSQDVGPQMNPGGANNPSDRGWLLREGRLAFLLYENGAKELYWMKSDPHQQRSKARTARKSLIKRLTYTVKAKRAASGQARRWLEPIS